MMGPQHVKSGAAVGIALLAVGAQLFGVLSIPDSALFVAIAAGAALVPDWDTRRSTVSGFFDIITVPIHWGLVWTHRIIYAATRRPLDPPSRNRQGRWRGAHRGITHSIPFALFLFFPTTLLLYVLPWFVMVGFILFLVLVASKSWIPTIVLVVYAVAGLHAHGSVMALVDHAHNLSFLWALALTAGMIAHDLGDCPTTKGVALWAPFSWRPITLPFSFRTNGIFERYVVRTVLMIAMAYMVIFWFPFTTTG